MEKARQPRKILVVDDDHAFSTALSSALRRRKNDCWVAHDIASALHLLDIHRPGFICIDLRLQNENGMDLLERIRAKEPHARIVMLTGYGSIRTAVAAIKMGATQYLTKPISASDLLDAFDGRAEKESSLEARDTASLSAVEWEHLNRVLTECGGNVSEAARRLNMHRRTLQRKLAKRRDG